MAGRSESVDQKTRLRIAANLRRLKWERKFSSAAAMARRVGISRDAMRRYLSGERTVGLDVALLVHRNLNVSLDWLVDEDPEDARWLDPEYEPEQLSSGAGRSQRKTAERSV
jgi:transcriptional regulator with XRE-family HTH domain